MTKFWCPIFWTALQKALNARLEELIFDVFGHTVQGRRSKGSVLRPSFWWSIKGTGRWREFDCTRGVRSVSRWAKLTSSLKLTVRFQRVIHQSKEHCLQGGSKASLEVSNRRSSSGQSSSAHEPLVHLLYSNVGHNDEDTGVCIILFVRLYICLFLSLYNTSDALYFYFTRFKIQFSNSCWMRSDGLIFLQARGTKQRSERRRCLARPSPKTAKRKRRPMGIGDEGRHKRPTLFGECRRKWIMLRIEQLSRRKRPTLFGESRRKWIMLRIDQLSRLNLKNQVSCRSSIWRLWWGDVVIAVKLNECSKG